MAESAPERRNLHLKFLLFFLGVTPRTGPPVGGGDPPPTPIPALPFLGEGVAFNRHG